MKRKLGDVLIHHEERPALSFWWRLRLAIGVLIMPQEPCTKREDDEIAYTAQRNMLAHPDALERARKQRILDEKAAKFRDMLDSMPPSDVLVVDEYLQEKLDNLYLRDIDTKWTVGDVVHFMASMYLHQYAVANRFDLIHQEK
jgi:hypothetical protein